MRRYPFKTPALITWLQPKGLLWRMDKGANAEAIYLTFDDGPHPEVTPQVLALLHQYNAKATFFCVGENAERYPEIVQQILDEGHTLGNHTYNHLKGWVTPTPEYVENVLKATECITSAWFRPPYGRITHAQAKALQQRGFRIVMWDVLSGDFDTGLTAAICAEAVLKNACPGSIVVLHDSAKAAPRCLPALETILKHYTQTNTPLRALPPCAMPVTQNL